MDFVKIFAAGEGLRVVRQQSEWECCRQTAVHREMVQHSCTCTQCCTLQNTMDAKTVLQNIMIHVYCIVLHILCKTYNYAWVICKTIHIALHTMHIFTAQYTAATVKSPLQQKMLHQRTMPVTASQLTRRLYIQRISQKVMYLQNTSESYVFTEYLIKLCIYRIYQKVT